MAAVVCQLCRDAGEQMPVFQMLIYPVTDSSRQSPSRRALAEGYFLTRTMIDWFWNAYVPPGPTLPTSACRRCWRATSQASRPPSC